MQRVLGRRTAAVLVVVNEAVLQVASRAGEAEAVAAGGVPDAQVTQRAVHGVLAGSAAPARQQWRLLAKQLCYHVRVIIAAVAEQQTRLKVNLQQQRGHAKGPGGGAQGSAQQQGGWRASNTAAALWRLRCMHKQSLLVMGRTQPSWLVVALAQVLGHAASHRIHCWKVGCS